MPFNPEEGGTTVRETCRSRSLPLLRHACSRTSQEAGSQRRSVGTGVRSVPSQPNRDLWAERTNGGRELNWSRECACTLAQSGSDVLESESAKIKSTASRSTIPGSDTGRVE